MRHLHTRRLENLKSHDTTWSLETTMAPPKLMMGIEFIWDH
jgi:hypothetical protein